VGVQRSDDGGGRHRVVVVGGGFGGMAAARWLGRQPVDVTLVDRKNHHLFQPLLYQVATGTLSPGQVAPPIRHTLRKRKNVKVEMAEVTAIDLDRRIVHAGVAGGPALELPYDSLIVAAGATQSYFGHDEMALHAPGMKTISDALELRRRIFGAFELAELLEDPAERRRWLTFVVVGAGPTGVELAGQVRELATRCLKGEFRRVEPQSARVVLVDGGKEPLATFGNRLSGRARKELEGMGVELRMGLRVVGTDADGVDVVGTEGATSRIEARTTIWAAGVEASELAGELARGSGATVDRAGRVEVQADLSLPGHPEVFAVGDMMSLDHLPGMAEVAMQGGLHAANTIVRRLDGKETGPFKYRDLGSAAAVGRFRAIVSVGPLRLSGFPAWFVWMFVHLAFLEGFGNRLGTMLRWLRSFVGRSRVERAFSMAHEGGDLSLPDSVRHVVQPNPYPVASPPAGGTAAGETTERT
jgi:NADH:ubiquinone reductase (H+-translocating)